MGLTTCMASGPSLHQVSRFCIETLFQLLRVLPRETRLILPISLDPIYSFGHLSLVGLGCIRTSDQCARGTMIGSV